jgi:hypothetical protein
MMHLDEVKDANAIDICPAPEVIGMKRLASQCLAYFRGGALYESAVFCGNDDLGSSRASDVACYGGRVLGFCGQ